MTSLYPIHYSEGQSQDFSKSLFFTFFKSTHIEFDSFQIRFLILEVWIIPMDSLEVVDFFSKATKKNINFLSLRCLFLKELAWKNWSRSEFFNQQDFIIKQAENPPKNRKLSVSQSPFRSYTNRHVFSLNFSLGEIQDFSKSLFFTFFKSTRVGFDS